MLAELRAAQALGRPLPSSHRASPSSSSRGGEGVGGVSLALPSGSRCREKVLPTWRLSQRHPACLAGPVRFLSPGPHRCLCFSCACLPSPDPCPSRSSLRPHLLQEALPRLGAWATCLHSAVVRLPSGSPVPSPQPRSSGRAGQGRVCLLCHSLCLQGARHATSAHSLRASSRRGGCS